MMVFGWLTHLKGDCILFIIPVQDVGPNRDSATNGPPKKLLPANAPLISLAVDLISAYAHILISRGKSEQWFLAGKSEFQRAEWAALPILWSG